MEPLNSQTRIWRQAIVVQNPANSKQKVSNFELAPGSWDAPGSGDDPGITQGWNLEKLNTVGYSEFPAPYGSIISTYTFTYQVPK